MPQLNIQQAFALALQHHQAGRLPEAERTYRQILTQQPSHAGAIHYLGVLAHHQGRADVGVELIRRAIAISPGLPAAQNNLGLALTDAGRIDEAIAAYRQAIAQKPGDAAAHCNLGNALKHKGQIDEAIAAYRRAIAHNPRYAQAHYNLGNALKAHGQLDEAIDALRRAVTLNPGFAEANNNLAIALAINGRFDEAVAIFRQTIAAHPGYAEAQFNLGNAFRDQRRFDEAIVAYQAAIAINPNYAGACNNMGNALKDTGRLDDAILAYRRSVALAPEFVEAHSNLIYALHYHPGVDAAAIAQEQRIWNRQHAEPRKPTVLPLSDNRDPDRRLRIGYVSPDLCEHVVGGFLLPLLQNHDRQSVEIFAYAQVPSPDAMTARLKMHTDGWRSIVGLSDAQAAELIRRDKIDVLVDLALHTASNRLLIFAHKPAPVQATYLAYAGSSGLTTMDYRLSDPYLDPPGEDESIYSEQTFRLPETYWCYQAGVDQPVGPPPALANGFITFGCLNNFCKINEPLLKLWAQVLQTVPHSRLILHAPEGRHRQHVAEQLQREGVAPERVEFVGKQSLAAYFAQYQSIDIALDTTPYAGGTTTCDALFMGVPVVSLIGKTAVGRAGASILSNLGLRDLLARTGDEYVQIAATLAHDLPRLHDMRSGLRSRMERSPLMDAARFARNVESAYRQMWRNWCTLHASRSPGTPDFGSEAQARSGEGTREGGA
jgi:predicted O-linked N-acetylglucosamine transferase (SPINDLY family)